MEFPEIACFVGSTSSSLFNEYSLINYKTKQKKQQNPHI